MEWYILVAVISLAICLAGIIWRVVKLIRLGAPVDYAPPAGKTSPAIKYSFTGAMSPTRKESAFLHLPTYTAGIVYHLGTFLSLLLFVLALFGLNFTGVTAMILAACLLISFACGTGILIKRICKKALRDLSNPDDYISNIVVTLFQLMTALGLIAPAMIPYYFLSAALLCLVFPFGKLRHAIFFFAARFHLGYFFGWRGVWPPEKLPEN